MEANTVPQLLPEHQAQEQQQQDAFHEMQQQLQQQYQQQLPEPESQMLDTKKGVFNEFTDREAIKAASENVIGFVNFDLSKSEAAAGMTENSSGNFFF